MPRQMKPAILLILAFLSASIIAPLAWQVHAQLTRIIQLYS
jgi:hypothetical protein